MEFGTIKPIEITQEMRSAYLDYAMSTIVARALPDVRDGLKPVQRRIIYVMHQLGLQHTAPYKKSARIVGDTLGRYHPHGDTAVYEAMVRLAQDFSMRYPLVDGQGNFGCFTADTKVKLLDGSDRSFAELAEAYGSDQPFYVYSIDDSGGVVVAEGRNSRITRRNVEVIELELVNGGSIRCTPDHRFMLRDGTYKQAQDLTTDDSLMPGYLTTASAREGLSDRIVAKRMLAERFDVYDITVEPHHNFMLSSGVFVHNSVDGDPPAAQRYTEARLAAIAEEMLRDIDKETVDFVPNFDGTLEEPKVLPAGLPNLLLNGAAGIAVGMATNIPPHNLGELCAALSLLIDNPAADVDELMRVMPGPDFPTGGLILSQEGIRAAYSSGKGHFVVRAKAHIEEATRGRYSIIVSELPYQVNKARLLERIAELVKQERLNEISDLRDESDRTGMRIVITLKREAQAEVVLNQLFKFTQMQVTFGVNLLALVDGTQPRVLTLKRILQHYITYRQEVIIRRTRFELDKARHRAHILEGLLIALDFIDEVIETIRRSQTADTAKANLMKRFKLSELQAQAILDLQLRRLAALERKKIEEEYREIKAKIAELEDILAHPQRVLEIIKGDLQALQRQYGDTRRTRITGEEAGEISAADLIPDIEVLVTVSERGYIKRLPLDSYRRQARSRAQVRSREQDAVAQAAIANTKDDLLLFSDRGKAYMVKAHQLPDAERDPKGLPLSNLVSIDAHERVVGMAPVHDWESGSIVLITRGGKVKRTALAEFRQARSNGILAIVLEEGDTLIGAGPATGSEDIVVVTAQGQAIRFAQEELRPMGRNAAGVRAIALAAKDAVVSMDLVRAPESFLCTMAGDGYGKRTPLGEYPLQGRGGKGVAAAKSGQRLAAARVVRPGDEVTAVSSKGVVVRLPAVEIPQRARATRGDRVVELEHGDAVAALVVVAGESPSVLPAAPEKAAPAKRRGPAAAEKKAPAAKKKAPPRGPQAAEAPARGPAAELAARLAAGRRAGTAPPPPKAPAPQPRPPAKARPTEPAAPPPGAPAKEKAAPAAAGGPPAAQKAAPTIPPEERPASKKTAPTPAEASARKKAGPPAPAGEVPAPQKGAPVRQMTLEEAIPPEEEGPPIVIRRMGRVLGAGEQEKPPEAPPSPPAQGPVIRILSEDPSSGGGPLPAGRRVPAWATEVAKEAPPPAAPAPKKAAPTAKKPAAPAPQKGTPTAKKPAAPAPRKGTPTAKKPAAPAPRKGTPTAKKPAAQKPPQKAPATGKRGAAQPAQGQKAAATPPRSQKPPAPAPSKRTDVGISPVLRIPADRASRDRKEDTPVHKKK